MKTNVTALNVAMNAATANTVVANLNPNDVDFAMNFDFLTNEEIYLEGAKRLTDEVKDDLRNRDVESKKALQGVIRRLDSYVQALTLYRQVGSHAKELGLQRQLVVALLTFTKGWDAVIKTSSERFVPTVVTEANKKSYDKGDKTYKDYYVDVVKYFLSKAAPAKVKYYAEFLAMLTWGITNLHNAYRIVTDEEINNMRGEAYKAHLRAKKYVGLPEETPITLEVGRSGIYMKAKPGAEIRYVPGNLVTKITRHHSYLLTKDEILTGLFNIHSRIRMHAKTEAVIEGKKQTLYSDYNVNPMGGVLSKVFLLKASNLDFSKLVEPGKEEYQKVVSVNKVGKVETVSLPTDNPTLRSAYLDSGLVSSSEAVAGYIAPLKTIEGLGAVAKIYGEKYFISLEEINKAAARNQKLNLGKGWNIGAVPVRVVFSTEKYFHVVGGKVVETAMDNVTMKKAMHDFGPSTLLLTEHYARRIGGLNRITSTMSQGGLKVATNFHKDFCEYNITGPNAFKGGIFAAMMLFAQQEGKIFSMEKLVNLGPEHIDQVVKTVISRLKTVEFNGYEVQVMDLVIDMKITNPYTVESFKYADEDLYEMEEQIDLEAEMDYVVNSANQKTSALRDYVMHRLVNEPDFMVGDWIEEQLAKGTIVLKKIATRLTASSYESIALWHGNAAAEAIMKFLAESMDYSNKVEKRTTTRLLRGIAKQKTKLEVNAVDLAELVKKHCGDISAHINTYPLTLKEALVTEFGFNFDCYKAHFIEVDFNGYKVAVPMFRGLLYTERKINSQLNFLATGFLKELLTAVKSFIKADDTMDIDTRAVAGEGMKLEALIQARLLGKKFGYLPAHGTYLVALNAVGMYDLPIDVLMTTNSQLFVDEEGNPVHEVLRGKYPLYHDLSMAKVSLAKYDQLGSQLMNILFAKAAFVSPDHMFSKLDDFDGDLLQVMVVCEAVLAFFKRFSNSYDKALGSVFHAGMLKEAKTSIKPSFSFTKFSMAEVQQAIINSATASKNIGIFTTAKYAIESVLNNMDTFTAVDGSEMVVTAVERNLIMGIISYLCQTESMDNMKHKGADNKDVKFLMECLNPSEIIKTFATSPADILSERKQKVAKLGSRIQHLCQEKGFKVPATFGQYMVNAIIAVADTLKDKGSYNRHLFSNNFVGDKRFAEVSENLSSGVSTNEFNLIGTLKNAKDAADMNSMYGRLLNVLTNV